MRRNASRALLATAVFLAIEARGAGMTIRRLDGSHITIDAASRIARETLAAHRVTGAQIAVVDRGRLVWSEAFGMRSLDPPLPMERTTTTWAASITKGVFATYVMQLVERGELDLDLPVARQLARPLNEFDPVSSAGRPA